MNPNEMWQVEVGGQIYEASLSELTEWIAEGSLLPGDRVRRGNLRWLDAVKVPALYGFFNAKELGLAPPPPVAVTVSTATDSGVGEIAPPATETVMLQTENFQPSNVSSKAAQFAPTCATDTIYAAPYQAEACVVHADGEPVFYCEGCANLFCRSCPKSYGGSVKICPMCGAMCRPLAAAREQQEKAFQYHNDLTQGFGFDDFGRALAYPFKFKTSLIAGAVIFMAAALGQSAAGVGGIFMAGAAIFCWMLSNMLTFGVLANTVNNMSQGRVNENFMPSFDDFNLWDDVVHPFFLSIGVYISSFGLLLAIVAGGVWYLWNTAAVESGQAIGQMSERMERAREEMRKAPGNGFAAGEEEYSFPDEATTPALTPQQQAALDEAEIQKLQEMIQESRKKELESVVGQTPDAERRQMREMFGRMASAALPLIILAFAALLWGLFYFPAACAVAGYTRSFAAAINPLVGLDTIRRMGFDYAKILLMCFIISVASGIIGSIFGLLLSPFEMPGVGNLPAKAIQSLFTFYFAVVFALILGFALYKNSAKLNLYRG